MLIIAVATDSDYYLEEIHDFPEEGTFAKIIPERSSC